MELNEEYHKKKLQEYLALKRSGKLEEIKAKEKAAPYRVYFDANGFICAFTNQLDFKKRDDWQTYKFPSDQIQMLQKDIEELSKYIVVEDRNHKGIFNIKVNKRETTTEVWLSDFLTEVNNSTDSETPTIKCKLTSNKFSVKLQKKIKKNQVNLETPVHFYLTAKNDPHWIFDQLSTTVGELIEHDYIYKDVVDVADCSVYTKKIFKSYGLVRK